MLFDFYGKNIFRVSQDNSDGMVREPESKPEAQILVNNPRRPVTKLSLTDEGGYITISTETGFISSMTNLLQTLQRKPER